MRQCLRTQLRTSSRFDSYLSHEKKIIFNNMKMSANILSAWSSNFRIHLQIMFDLYINKNYAISFGYPKRLCEQLAQCVLSSFKKLLFSDSKYFYWSWNPCFNCFHMMSRVYNYVIFSENTCNKTAQIDVIHIQHLIIAIFYRCTKMVIKPSLFFFLTAKHVGAS